MPWLKVTSGIIGIAVVLLNGVQYVPEPNGTNHTMAFLCITGLQIASTPFLYLFIKGIINLREDSNRPNILYEYALKVRQLLFDIQEI